MSEFKLTEPEHGMGSAVLRIQCDQALKRADRLSVSVAVVVDRAQGPPAFGPLRLQGKGLPVKSYSPIKILGIARLIGLLAESSEAPGCTPLCRGMRTSGHEQRNSAKQRFRERPEEDLRNRFSPSQQAPQGFVGSRTN